MVWEAQKKKKLCKINILFGFTYLMLKAGRGKKNA